MSNITKNKWISKANLEAKASLNRNFKLTTIKDKSYELINENLQRILNLNQSLDIIECIDISTIQGSFTVGSIVSFKYGKPNKSYYRKYKIKTLDYQNDAGSMNEVLTRHFNRKKIDGLEYPDLLLVDGGKSQMSAVKEVFSNLELKIPYFGLAKKNEELVIPDLKDRIGLDKNSRTLQLLVSIRDEAHRFAITYHKILRHKSTLKNVLENIPGIGPKKRTILINHFKTAEKVKAASKDELYKLRGISDSDAKSIYNYFQDF